MIWTFKVGSPVKNPVLISRERAFKANAKTKLRHYSARNCKFHSTPSKSYINFPIHGPNERVTVVQSMALPS